MKTLGFLFVVLVLSLSVSSYAQDVVKVTAEQQPEWLILNGVVEATQRSTVSAQTTGTVVELPFDVDDTVPQGALIVGLDNSEQASRVEQRQAEVASAEASLMQTQKQYQRVQQLFEQNAASSSERDQAEAAYNRARSAVKQARAALEEAQKQLSYTRVTAPYAGIVTDRWVELGESVQPGQRLITGLSLEQLRVVADVPQQFNARARDFATANIQLDSGTSLPATELTFFPYAQQPSHSFKLRMTVPSDGLRLLPGSAVDVQLKIGDVSVIQIPRSALRIDGELRAVYVVDDNDTPQLRQVYTGRVTPEQVEILAGLKPGEIVLKDWSHKDDE
tara:strand:+ start:3595 stop:4596 length:1002 start_codon:yes stop_codon:yes gene_type:complete